MPAPSSSDNVFQSGKIRGLAPNDEASESKGPTPNILAFRTITTLLGRLPRSTPIPAVDNLGQVNVESSERRETKILDAFAHVVTGDYNIAALVTNRGFYDSKELRVLFCVDYLPVDQSVSNRQISVTQRAKEWLLSFVRNDRSDDPDTGIEIPTIISAEAPNDIGTLGPHEYVLKLLECWKTPSLSNHLWILSKIFTPIPGSGEVWHMSTISRYIAAMSYVRMSRRLNQEYLSQPFVTSLKNLEVSKIPALSQPRRNPAYKQPSLPQANINSANEQQKRRENKSDLIFLKDVLPLMVEGRFRTDIRNLEKIAQDASATHPEDIQMYTDETRVEFHNILIELLDGYGKTLRALVDICGKRQGAEAGAKKAVVVLDPQAAASFAKHLRSLYRTGYALLRISRGRAFQMHLENIETLLPDHRAFIAGIQADQSDGDDQALFGKSKLQSYTAWLQLLVGHFDAVEILLKFVHSNVFRYESISIDILVAPKTDRALLPWRELFKNNIIPPSPNDDGPTNDDLLNFLEKHRKVFLDTSSSQESSSKESSSKASFSKVQAALLASKNLHPISSTIFTDLKDHADTNVAQMANEILAHINDYNAKPHEFTIKIGLPIHALQQKLQTISRKDDADLFFKTLDNTKFVGALHCEACLASLLPNFTNTTELFFESSKVEDMNMLMSKMQKFGRVIGVSKRCCPVCASFLKTLVKVPTTADVATVNAPEPFIVRGSHGTISACTLPPWTPDAIAKAMVYMYANKLREDLVAFKNVVENDAISNNRSRATGSERLSVDSFIDQDVPGELKETWRHKEGW